MKFLSGLIRYFVYITTGILFVFIIIMILEGSSSISLKTLIEIPCAAFVTSLATAVICSKDIMVKRDFYIGIAVHYLILCIIMVIFGTVCEWVNPDAAGILTIVISTAAIYVFTFAGAYLSSKSEAEKLNRALRNKREREKNDV